MCDPDSAHRKQCKRYDIPGHAHYVTFSCLRRQPLLARDRPRQWLLDAIRAAKTRYPFELWAWVIMPEHAHLLLLPYEGVRISGILQAIKQPVAQRALRYVKAHAPSFLQKMATTDSDGQPRYYFWQRGGGYDRNIWSLPEVLEKVRYIHENPVRRGLVDRPEQWPWSSWHAWESGAEEPFSIDRHSLPWVSG